MSVPGRNRRTPRVTRAQPRLTSRAEGVTTRSELGDESGRREARPLRRSAGWAELRSDTRPQGPPTEQVCDASSTGVDPGVGWARRTLDITLCLLVAPIAITVVLLAGAAILLTEGRPVFFAQLRVGEGGRVFTMLKLRTMRPRSDRAWQLSTADQDCPDLDPAVTVLGDPRVTSIGRWLRRTGLDEVPQLWHVLRGQMTLVGPRPESLPLAAGYPRDCREVLLARPGLTGPTQLAHGQDTVQPPPERNPTDWYLTDLVPRRVARDRIYLDHPTLRATLYWLLATARQVIRRAG